VSRLADKWGLSEVAAELGLPAPRTILPRADELDAAYALGVPVVAKPRRAEAARGLRFLATRAEVEQYVRSVASGDREPAFVQQEYVGGEVHNVGGCVQNGTFVSLLTNKPLFARLEHGGPGIVHVTPKSPRSWRPRGSSQLTFTGTARCTSTSS